MGANSNYIVNFSQIDKDDLDLIGKKAAEFGKLTRLGIPIPDGFVITTSFYNKFLEQTGISEKIKEVEKLNHPAIAGSIEKLFEPIKKQIMHAHIPESLTLELHKFYKKHAGLFKDKSLDIFSSSPKDNKFIMFKNVKGDANFILKIKEIWALQIRNPAAIIIQKNITSKTKGTIATNNPPKELEHIAYKIQKHFYFPKVLDYVIEKGKIYITAIKPFTGVINKQRRKILIKGISVNPGIATGPVKLINNQNLTVVNNSEIIVTKDLNKSLCNKIKRVKAVVTDAVLQTAFDRILYKKLAGIPIVRGTKNATKLLHNGNIITVNGTSGEIYSGGLIY